MTQFFDLNLLYIVIANLYLLVFTSHSAVSGLSPTEALLLLTKSFTNASILEPWTTETSPPCGGGAGDPPASPWRGVVCFKGIVTGLHLPNMGLSGDIDVDALVALPGLRSVSFINNSFSGSIPGFNRLGALKSIYVTGNQFSGEIPDSFFSKMKSLKKVYLGSNAFSGAIPSSLAIPPRMIELKLENNQFGGKLPDIRQVQLKAFNVSNNPNLEGEIPAGLVRFGVSSFNGDHNLCGEVVGRECIFPPAPTPSASPTPTPFPAPAPRLTIPAKTTSTITYSKLDSRKSKIIGGALAVVLCILTITALVVRQLTKSSFNTLGREESRKQRSVKAPVRYNDAGGNDEDVYDPMSSVIHHPRKSYSGSSAEVAPAASTLANLVLVNDEKAVFGLPDLMKAAAEVLSSSGGLGAAYKAVMAMGTTVVVKRMRVEMNKEGPEGFEAEMQRLGRLRHRNILGPLAFLYRKEEKLLIYEYIPGGSLYHLLHETKEDEQVKLDWRARLNIIRGIAKGLAYLHSELSNSNLPHGNLKSSNILLGPDLTAIVADFGCYPLLLPDEAITTLFAYQSPEALQYHHVSAKSDVFCFGIVVLEIISGKFPSQYTNENSSDTSSDLIQWASSLVKEGREFELFDPKMEVDGDAAAGLMTELVRLGAACVETNFKMRPDMREVVRGIDDIAQSLVVDGSEIVPIE